MTIRGVCMALALAAAVSQQACDAREPADEAVVERARRVLEATLRERHAGVERFELALIEPVGMRTQKDSTVVDFVVPNPGSLGRRACVVVRYKSADGMTRDSSIWWSISAFRTVAVTRRLIRSHEILRESDVVIQSKDVAGLGESFGELGEIGFGRRARRFITAGAVLQQSDLEYAPEVAREQQIKVNVGTGRVVVETIGVAAEEGRTGDVIRVTNPASKMRYTARVVGVGEVTVGGAPK